MIKNVDVAVYETIKKMVEGRFQGGVHEFGLNEGG
jgi:basic membrane protein A